MISPGGTLPPSYVEDETQEVKKMLDAEQKAPWTEGIVVKTALRHGPPFVEIIKYAKENGVDMIVMGTHGRSGLAHMMLGSVAEKVVRKAPCPVLTVHLKDHHFVMP